MNTHQAGHLGIAFALAMFTLSSCAVTQGKEHPTHKQNAAHMHRTEHVTEHRQKMAQMHERAATCLRSERNEAECHKEMMDNRHKAEGDAQTKEHQH